MNTEILLKAAKTLKKYLPDLLIGAGIAGGACTVALTAKATVKAVRKYDELDIAESDNKFVDTAKAVWTFYIPPIMAGAVSTYCILKAHKITAEKLLMLSSACKFTKEAFTELKEKVDDSTGENFANKINAQDSSSTNMIILPEKEYLCCDGLTGQMFTSNLNNVRDIYLNLCWRIINDMYISKFDYLEALDLDPSKVENSEGEGWNVYMRLLTPNVQSCQMEDGTPYLKITPSVMPKKDFDMIG